MNNQPYNSWNSNQGRHQGYNNERGYGSNAGYGQYNPSHPNQNMGRNPMQQNPNMRANPMFNPMPNSQLYQNMN